MGSVSKADDLDEVLIRLDPFIPIGEPITHRFGVPITHYERLSTILKGMSYQNAKLAYPEIERLLKALQAERDPSPRMGSHGA